MNVSSLEQIVEGCCVRLRYGRYYHRIAEVDLAISRRPIENAMKVAVAVEETWTCQGKLFNPTGKPGDMTAVLRSFEAAYSINGQDIWLEYLNGQPGYHQMLSRDCIGGTVVVEPPSFPSGKKGENHTFRTYRLSVKGIRPLLRSGWMQFEERISIKGGGRRWGCLEVNEGEGVRQQLRSNTICFATQSGSGIGYLEMPDPPPPIWPFALVDEFPDVELTSPETYGDQSSPILLNHGLTWNYAFQATRRLFGIPHFLRG